MFSNLDHVAGRFDLITEKLNSGTLEPKEFQALAKEQASLRELIATYRDWLKTKGELSDNKTLIESEKDEPMRVLIKQEINTLEEKIPQLEATLKVLLLPKDPNDEKNTILEIRAGTGGDEASLFAGDLFRMYARFAERNRWTVEILSSSETGKGGFKEVIALITGERVFSGLKYEGGIHRVQRVPDTEASGRVHTSAVTVAVLPEAEDVEVNVPETDLRVDVFRAGGHGGQSVNTTDSAVRLTHLPSGLVVICQDEKSQHKNKAKALKVLKSRLLDKAQNEQHAKETSVRRAMVGSGDRSEKIRTYNFPQSRITDHRIGLTLHNLREILEGDLKLLLEALQAHDQAETLKQQSEKMA